MSLLDFAAIALFIAGMATLCGSAVIIWLRWPEITDAELRIRVIGAALCFSGAATAVASKVFSA